jgi:F-box domain
MLISSISTLPSELILNISSRLDLKDLVKAGRTCKTWNNLINENDNNVNKIWKRFLDIICVPIIPNKKKLMRPRPHNEISRTKFLKHSILTKPIEKKTSKSLLIEKINICIDDTNIKSVDYTSDLEAISKVIQAHILLNRLGLSTLDQALTYVNILKTLTFPNMVEKGTLLAGNFYAKVGFEYIKNHEIEKAKKTFSEIRSGDSSDKLARRISKYYIKANKLDKALSVMKSVHLLNAELFLAFALLIGESARTDRSDIGLEVLNYLNGDGEYQEQYLFMEPEIPNKFALEDLKEIPVEVQFTSFGIYAKYLYNFFVKKDENAHITDPYRSEVNVLFYLKNDCLSKAEEVALSLEDPEKQEIGLRYIIQKYEKKGNEKEVVRLYGLLEARLKKS